MFLVAEDGGVPQSLLEHYECQQEEHWMKKKKGGEKKKKASAGMAEKRSEGGWYKLEEEMPAH